MSNGPTALTLRFVLIFLFAGGMATGCSSSPSEPDPVTSFQLVTDDAVEAMGQALSDPIGYSSWERVRDGGRMWDEPREMTISNGSIHRESEIEVMTTNSLTTPYRAGFTFKVDFTLTAQEGPSREVYIIGTVFFDGRPDGSWTCDHFDLSQFIEQDDASGYVFDDFDHSKGEQMIRDRLLNAISSVSSK